MTIFFWFIAFFIGLGLLIKSADVITEALEKIGLKYKASPFLLGATVVALGATLPELATALMAIQQNQAVMVPAIAIGSNIANIFLVIGLAAFLGKTLIIKKAEFNTDWPFLIGATVLILAILWDKQVTMGEGIVAVLACLAFAVYHARIIKAENIGSDGLLPGQDLPATREKWFQFRKASHDWDWKFYLSVILSLVGLWLGSLMAVQAMVKFAAWYDVSVAVPSMLLLGIGTALPELLVTLSAISKGNNQLALSMVFASNIFNILLVIGLPALFSTLKADDLTLSVGLPFLITATFLYLVSFSAKKIFRWEGGVYLFIYLLFIFKLLGWY